MIYKANDKYNANLTQGFTVGDTTLYVSAVPTNVPTIVVVNKGEDNEGVYTVTGKTSNSLTGVAWLKGANDNLDNNAPITCLNNEEFLNQYASAVFSAEGFTDLIYGVDGEASDTYKISLGVEPTDYASIIGVPIVFKANTANTAAATLDINTLGPIAIKKAHDQALATGDIEAGQLVIVTYDGTNFQMQSQLANIDVPVKATAAELDTGTDDAKFATALAIAGRAEKDGWTPAREAWTYNAADKINVPAGAVSKYQKGDRIKFTQTTVKYAVIVDVADTLLTIAINTDYVVANAAITLPYYSHEVNPLGYPGWFAYTSTLTGFSANPSGVITRFNILGNMCTAQAWDSGAGTSNATTKTWTAPVANTAPRQSGVNTWGLDNNVVIHAQHIIGQSSNVVSSYVGLPVGTLWTASGNCRLFPNGLTLIYEF